MMSSRFRGERGGALNLKENAPIEGEEEGGRKMELTAVGDVDLVEEEVGGNSTFRGTTAIA